VGVGPTATPGPLAFVREWPAPNIPETRAERDEFLRGAALAPACRVPGAGLTAAPGRHIPGIVPVELLPARTDTHSVLLTQGPAQALRRRWCPGVILLALLPIYEPVPGRHQILTPDSWS
jgi:hypothetical protein